MSWRDAVIWMALMTGVLGLGHFYVYRRLVADASLARRTRLSLLLALCLLLCLVPLTFASMRSLPRSWLTAPSFVVFGWMGLLSTWFSLLVLTDVSRLVSAVVARLRGGRSTPASEATLLPRRRALARLVAGSVALGGAALTGTGVAIAAYGFRKRRLEVTLAKLPAAFDGFKIVQVSDIHVGPTIGRDFVLSMVAAANEEQADLIAITGERFETDINTAIDF